MRNSEVPFDATPRDNVAHTPLSVKSVEEKNDGLKTTTKDVMKYQKRILLVIKIQ